MAAEKKPVVLTDYVVLSLRELEGNGDQPQSWDVIAYVTARSREAAIKSAADQKQVGVYNAVPKSSFTAVRVAPKTTVQLELTEVKP